MSFTNTKTWMKSNGLRLLWTSWALSVASVAVMIAKPVLASGNDVKVSPAPPAFSLRLDPAAPKVGEPVTPIIEGIWPNGCIPEGGKLVVGSYRSLLTITLPGPPEQILCFSALRPYSVRLPSVVFPLAGSYEVQAISSWGQLIGEAKVNIRSEQQAVSSYDVNGVWFEPSTAGSGLLLNHPKSGAVDSTFGAWFTFGLNGESRWYSLQNGKWQSSTLLRGDVFESKSDPRACTLQFPNPECDVVGLFPTKAISTTKIGTYSIEFENAQNGSLRFNALNGAMTREIKITKMDLSR
jgi:hypothetical protein